MAKQEIDIGIPADKRQQVADKLKVLLADSYTLYLQTHNFHWNVTGPQFRELHLMFEEQYTELALAVDEIAERIICARHLPAVCRIKPHQGDRGYSIRGQNGRYSDCRT